MKTNTNSKKTLSENQLEIITKLSIELSSISTLENLYSFIALRLKEITGAIAVAINEYDKEKKVIVTRQIETDSTILEKIKSLSGLKIIGMESPVNDETYNYILRDIIGFHKSLHDVSFGAISKTASSIITTLLNIDYYVGMAFVFENELYGTAMLVMAKGTEIPGKDFLKAIVSIIWVSLRRVYVEKKLKSVEIDYQNLLANIQDIYYRTGKDSKIKVISESGRTLLGEAVYQKFINSAINDEIYYYKDERQKFLEQLYLKKKLKNYELTLKNSNNEPVIVSVNCRIIFDDKSEFDGIEGTMRDISSKKRTENLLNFKLYLSEITSNNNIQNLLIKSLNQIGLLCYCSHCFIIEYNGDLSNIFNFELSSNDNPDQINKIQLEYSVKELFNDLISSSIIISNSTEFNKTTNSNDIFRT